MLTIGLLGGMSWESTLPYYRIINETVRERAGALHSARLVLYSIDFQELEPLQHAGRWVEAGELLAGAARAIERAGADLLVICTNTMHNVAEQIQARIGIPILHIVDATAAAIHANSLRKVGLLGARFTMEQAFYRQRLERSGLEVLTPDEDDRVVIHRVIYDELCRGEIRESSRDAYRAIIQRLVARGAEGVILGCTEISLLIGADNWPVPLFDTTTIHARAAVEAAL